MRVLNRHDVAAALTSGRISAVQVVQDAYIAHSLGHTSLPFSCFLRPQGHPDDRIIALPAQLNGQRESMGIKWISSFPGNTGRGLQRASSVMVLNDPDTGYPTAVLEASQISATRTAASAAIASHTLHATGEVRTVGIVGAGTINRRVLDLLAELHPDLRTVHVHDVAPERAARFARSVAAEHPHLEVEVCRDLRELFSVADTVSIATTDSSYWLDLDHDAARQDQVILHLSLRDLSVGSVLGATNVVDDVDHVCREATSIDLAARETGGRSFIAATIGELLSGAGEPPRTGGPVVFSPFGLGVLDLALAQQVLDVAEALGLGLLVDGFDPGEQRFAGPAEER